MNRKFLVFPDADHAVMADGMVLGYLVEHEGAHGEAWSGVYTDGVRYGILWGEPVRSALGDPEEDAAMVLADEDSSWHIHEAPNQQGL